MSPVERVMLSRCVCHLWNVLCSADLCVTCGTCYVEQVCVSPVERVMLSRFVCHLWNVLC